jgi:hypothetical protein
MMLTAEKPLTLFALILALAVPGKAVRLSGEWSTLFYRISNTGSSWVAQENLRLEFLVPLPGGFDLEYGGKLILEAPSRPLPEKESGYRLFAVREKALIHGDGYRLLYDTRQLAFSVYTESADLIFGRQVIAWGASKITNPTDLFAPVALRDFERDVRDGVDGVRLRIPTGMASELDFGAVGEKREGSLSAAFFGRGSFSLENADGSFIYAYTDHNHFTGADFAGYLGQAGYWLEGGLYWRRSGEGGNAGAVSAGLEGHLTPSLYTAAELLWAHPSYPLPSFRDAGVENSKTASLLVTLQRGLWTFSAKVLTGLDEPEEVLLLQGEYNIKENTYAKAGAMFVNQERSRSSSSFMALKIYF